MSVIVDMPMPESCGDCPLTDLSPVYDTKEKKFRNRLYCYLIWDYVDVAEIHYHNCELKEFGECSYSETGCSDCLVKAKIRKALSDQICKDNSVDVGDAGAGNGQMDKSQKRQRLIDADELWEKMYRYTDNEGAKMPYGDDDSLIHKDSACFLIENAPIIEPERKTGRWIIRYNPRTGWYSVTCSECGEDVTSEITMIGFPPNAKAIWDYCPYCGCRMAEGEQDGVC